MECVRSGSVPIRDAFITAHPAGFLAEDKKAEESFENSGKGSMNIWVFF